MYNYCNFIDKTFFVWYKSQSCGFKVKSVFTPDNAPFHVSKLTCVFFEHSKSTREKIMEQLLSSSVLKLIKKKSMISCEEGSKQQS